MVLDRAHIRLVPDVFQNVASVRGGNADHFGNVQRGTTAKTDDAIRLVHLVGRSTFHHLAAGRIAKDPSKDGHIEPGQMRLEFS